MESDPAARLLTLTDDDVLAAVALLRRMSQRGSLLQRMQQAGWLDHDAMTRLDEPCAQRRPVSELRAEWVDDQKTQPLS